VRRFGGSDGNEQLTAVVATLLLILLAIEGATLLNIRSLLTVHVFVGMLLVPVIALKLASTGWRMLRYYLGADDYVRRGPPHPFLRMVVAPLAVVTTIVLFATGVALVVLDRTSGIVVGLHKASFVVWFGAVGVHVIVRIVRLPDALRLSRPGVAVRVGLAAATVAAGVTVATLSLPAADHLQDRVSVQVGFDGG